MATFTSINDAAGQQRLLLEPYAYMCEMPGKNVRRRMVDAFQLWLHTPEHAVAEIKTIVDELHNASLLCVSTSL